MLISLGSKSAFQGAGYPAKQRKMLIDKRTEVVTIFVVVNALREFQVRHAPDSNDFTTT
jgi:hypothetical protein